MKTKDNFYLTIDIETTGLDRFNDKITFIGIGYTASLDEKIPKITVYNMQEKEQEQQALQVLKKIERCKAAKLIFQNGKFDTLFLEIAYNIKLKISDDTMLLGTVYDLTADHNLKDMAKNYLKVDDWDISTREKKSGKNIIIPYLKKDVEMTWRLYRFFKAKIKKPEQRKLYKKLLLPAYKMYRIVERNGIYIDLEELKQVRKDYQQERENCLERLKDFADINWNSSKQITTAFYTDNSLPILSVTNSGNPSADAATLHKLKARGYQVAADLLEFRQYDTALKMFLTRWDTDAAFDGRLHPSFNLTNVVSGRTSCNNPNLQQCPKDKRVRGLFKAPNKKRMFFEADYSQLELRLAAHYSKDKTMIKIYKNDGDIHTETAKALTGGREPSKAERSMAKPVNFGFLYGMQAKKFVEYAFNSYGVSFTLEQAEEYRAAFFKKYKGLLPWHEKQAQLCVAQGGVYTLFGRFRKLPKIYSQNKYERGEAERCAINSPVQGTGSDILLCAALELQKYLAPEGLKICGTIHDSVVGEFWAEDEPWIVDEIKYLMEQPELLAEFGVELAVPLKVDVGVGPWGSK